MLAGVNGGEMFHELDVMLIDGEVTDLDGESLAVIDETLDELSLYLVDEVVVSTESPNVAEQIINGADISPIDDFAIDDENPSATELDVTTASSNRITLKATAPTPVSPVGSEVVGSLNPVLTLTNASGKYVSAAFSYRIEISEEKTGITLLIESNAVPQTDTTTSYTVNQMLQQNTVYRWKARAELDGAYGPWSSIATFRTLTIEAPTPTSPVGGVAVDSLRPTLVVKNGAVSGPVGTVSYEFHVDDEVSFATPSTFKVARSDGSTTSAQVQSDLQVNSLFYWRVRATTGTSTSNWSTTQSFRTQTIEAPTPVSPTQLRGS